MGDLAQLNHLKGPFSSSTVILSLEFEKKQTNKQWAGQTIFHTPKTNTALIEFKPPYV